MANDKIYERLTEADSIIQKLHEKYPDVLWQVRPTHVTVLCITNKDKPKKSKNLFKVTPIKGVNKAIAEMSKIDLSYVIEVFASDWNQWSQNLREWVIMEALLHVHEEEGKLIKTDCDDFRIVLDVIGVDWETRIDLPSLTESDVKFNLALRPGLDDEDKDDNDDTDDVDEKEI